MYQPKIGAIAFVEFFPKGPARVKRYFETVFGWKLAKERVKGVDIWYWDASNGPGGHMMAPMGDMARGSTVAFVRVNSVDEVTSKVTKNGGKILVPKYEVPGRGWFAWFEAPGGIVHEVYQQQGRGIFRPGRKRRR